MSSSPATTGCLSGEQLRQCFTEELAEPQLRAIEEHIAACATCRGALESTVGDERWWRDAESTLHATVGFDEVASRSHSGSHNEPGSSALEDVLHLLGPTDDPRMLGRIGQYEVVGLIGRGGMGAVFKALDSALNRFVAIKILLPHLAASEAARKRFAREGQAAAAVVDNHVLPIFAVDQWREVPYLVMQYSRSITLQKRVNDQGPLSICEILRIGFQTARGLAAAHAQGLVHRDVKPSNILLDATVERAVLTDFGLARAADDVSMTTTGMIAGTPQYMSPEQVRGQGVDARSDLFSLGCVLYFLATGQPPFQADNSYAILRQITDAEPRPVDAINSDIPEWLGRIIAR